ncbi:hypothetical protein QQS45_08430 [Alteriqipengyuania flavescens]|uniref:hypothetical protein n=1 Tax=Alteriqipengyuania flavescens TaxID=3053610 RepID=UPI0025B4DD0A|nr:hypothetical protein [Alteriqipengyuania flavescens]WJY17673.1 hypothetical protein QQW98_08425 [Alteriqipengyuania flavescens]WJY23616.1 hypothetical protein QQS45_08430 [Alteriqipengyuania flavescens]
MAILSFTTELEAVNSMLASIGQSPVPGLDDSGIEDANRARDTLRATTRGVLTRGYDFNTDEGYELRPDSEGLIKLPTGVLEIDPSDNSQSIVARRHPNGALCLWNKADKTWAFDGPVACDIVWGFEFIDLPETARAYITTSAGRQFQQGSVGAQILDRFEAEDESRLFMMLEKREAKSRRANVLRDNPAVSGSVNNRRY